MTSSSQLNPHTTTTLWLVVVVVALTLSFAPPLSHAVVTENTACCSCQTMLPENVPSGVEPQVMPSPFKIKVQEEGYDPGQIIHLNLTADPGEKFRSFMLVAYTTNSVRDKSRLARGEFELLDQDYEIRTDCFARAGTQLSSAVYSVDSTPVSNLRFKWTPAVQPYGHIEFRATFVKNDREFWAREKSAVLYDKTIGMPKPAVKKFIPPINTEQCGKSKGCYRVPEGCTEPQCLYILTWNSDGASVTFELGGLSTGQDNSYVAAALSEDTYVGDDVVFVCAHNGDYDTTEVYIGTQNEEYETKLITKYEKFRNGDKMERGKNFFGTVMSEAGNHQNNRLLCRFTIQSYMNTLQRGLKSLRGRKFHLIMSHGLADDGQPYPMGVGYNEFPHISENEVSFKSTSDLSGRHTYPLVKAHGCLMIIAWIFFSSIGMLLAKYYQPMWPEKRIAERKYWFMGHFQFMSMVFILVVIAIILIFIEGDGWTKAKDLPYRAHPILGIIIFVCVLLLPLIALLRPGKGHDCRNVFNWLYWIFATIANVLAVPNIFIGMDFGKSMVPWWATWILVFWVIFHIIVEITLEIHGCMMHKKNKDRRKKHELLKRDYPKQHHPKPEPAGRRFKRFMLSLHFCVTLLITVIMVIIIAVSS